MSVMLNAKNPSSSSLQLDSEREIQARVGRLARFNVKLSQSSENLLSAKHKTLESELDQASLDKLDFCQTNLCKGLIKRR
ncbi:SAC3 family protein B isoform X1 [Canna indica]|uniref:SAC3 family protein B isoform X1 n=1 Tax=Canna indica TaxID=4628 RepID=A0AAQ3KFW9_9LILI|nr:SAC3 family protein B isoform X1 [Canna indica]